MNNLQKIVIAKSFSEKEIKLARAEIRPGQYEIDFIVRFRGILSVAQDTEKSSTVSIPLLPALALALRYAGITGQAAQKAILAGVKAALLQKESPADVLSAGLEGEIERLKKEIQKSLPKTPVKGKVKFTGTIEEISCAG